MSDIPFVFLFFYSMGFTYLHLYLYIVLEVGITGSMERGFLDSLFFRVDLYGYVNPLF
jgi:hypothetical protein